MSKEERTFICVCGYASPTRRGLGAHLTFAHTEKGKIIRQKMADQKRREGSPSWRGDNVGYTGIHIWINRNIPKPKACQRCGAEKRLDAANISGQYTRDPSDWEWLCRHCHMASDGRLAQLAVHNFKPGNNRQLRSEGVAP